MRVKCLDASAARAQAELEVARRGPVTTVVSLYYGAVTGEERLQIAGEALAEGESLCRHYRKARSRTRGGARG